MPNNANVDERVVEMRIDNRQFVNGAEKTISVLDKLKKALSFKDADDGLDNLQKSADRLDLTGVAEDLEQISSRFSTMGLVGMNVIKNLTDTIGNFVTKTIKGLTIDPITTGFQKYEEIARSTATILAATRSEFEEFGQWGSEFGGGVFATQLEYVENGLATLTWYADETSAKMTDMVNNIGKFTNAGVKFENAVVEMMGVTNWGYQSGATAAEQARAMYNLSQAIAAGSVKLMDWRSIENANMATLEFKQTVLDTAVAEGTLKKAADGTYKTLNGTVVTAQNFSQALQDGFFTSNVLQKTLIQYGEYSRRLDAALNDTGFKNFGITAADVMEAMEMLSDQSQDYSLQDWHADLAEIMGDEVPDIEALRYQYELLTDAEVDLSRRAFLAGQEYRTFADVIEAVSDAVSSGWMTTFQAIIGNTEEAKEVWTALGDELNDIFASSAAVRNAVLGLWKDPNQENGLGKNLVSGRESLLNAIATLYKGVRTYIDPILDAFHNVFKIGDNTKDIARKLLDLTYRFEDWTKKVALSEKATEGLRNIFTKVFSLVKSALGVFKPFFSIVGTGIGFLKDTFELFLESFADAEKGFDKDHFLAEMPAIFGSISDKVNNAWDSVKDFVSSLKDIPIVGKALFGFQTIIETIASLFTGTKEDLEGMETPVNKLSELWNKVLGSITSINIDTKALRENFGKVGEVFGAVYEGIVGDPEAFKARLTEMFTKAIEAAKEALSGIKLSDVFEGAKAGTLLYMASQFAVFVSSFTRSAKKFETIPESITGVFQSINKAVDNYGNQFKANTILKIAAAIGILAVSMGVMALIPEHKLAQIAVTLSFFFIILARIAKNLSSMNEQFSNNKKLTVNVLPKFAAGLIAVAILLGVAAAAIMTIAKLSRDDLGKSLTGIAAILLVAASTLILLSKKMDSEVDVKALGKIVAIGLVIRAAGKALASVKDMDWTQIISSGLALGIVIAAVAAALYATKEATAGSGFGSMLTMLSMIGVMYAMVPLLIGINKILSSGGGENLVKSIGILALVGSIAVLFARAMSKIGAAKGALKGAAMLALIGASLVLFSAALAIAAPAIIVLLTGLVGVLALVREMTKDPSGMLAAVGIMVALAAIFAVVGVGAAFLGAGILMAAAGFVTFSAGLLMVATAIGILAVALVPLGKAFVELGNLIAENGDVIIGVVAVLITGVLAALLGSRIKMAMTVIAIVLTVLEVLHQYGPLILDVIGTILEDVLKFILTLVPMLIKFVVLAAVLVIDGAANSIRSNSGAIISAIENLISAILELFVEAFIRIAFDAFGGLWAMFAKAFGVENAEEVAADIREAGKYLGSEASSAIGSAFGISEREGTAGADSIIDSFNNEFVNRRDDISGSLTEVIGGIYNSDVVKATQNTGDSIGTGLTDGIKETITNLAPGLSSSIESPLTSALDQSDNAGTLGDNFSISYINNIYGTGGENHIQDAYNAAFDLSSASVQGAADGQQSHSPSRLAGRLGRFFVQGYVGGIEDNADDAYIAGKDLTVKMADGVQNALAIVAALADEDFSISPTITPVVDMTNVDQAAGAMSDMFSDSATARTSRINRTMSELDEIVNAARSAESRGNSTVNNTYEVNVYASEGMDEDALADAVLFRLSKGIVRKGAALG